MFPGAQLEAPEKVAFRPRAAGGRRVTPRGTARAGPGRLWPLRVSARRPFVSRAGTLAAFPTSP